VCPKLSSCACVPRARHYPSLPVVALRGEVVEWVFKFKYLNTLVFTYGDILAKVQARVVKVIGTFASLKPILLNKAISLSTQMLFYMTFIPPTFTFGCECWALKPAMANHLQAHTCLSYTLCWGQLVGQDPQCWDSLTLRRVVHCRYYQSAVDAVARSLGLHGV
jgi:hypothetical protein